MDILGSVVSAPAVDRRDVGEASGEEVEDTPGVEVCASAELAAAPRNSRSPSCVEMGEMRDCAPADPVVKSSVRVTPESSRHHRSSRLERPSFVNSNSTTGDGI
uniref:Uncharacterized protein n=1 Tax=Bionectria ochroleuca TaxID=29856 RepID=A0A8H7NA03_BIOOC